jgi:hypothetical protein
VLNSVPRYFTGFRTVMPSASGAGPFGPAASWLIASSFLSVFGKAAKPLLLRLRGSSVYLGLGQSLTPPSPAEELSATVEGILVLVAGSECVPGGWPWSRRRAGSGPVPSRGVLLARNERSILAELTERITQLQYLLQLSLRTSQNSVNAKFAEFLF